jgi:hypothetical protein
MKNFRAKWTDRGGPMPRPRKSPGLSSFASLLWRIMRATAYAHPMPGIITELKIRIIQPNRNIRTHYLAGLDRNVLPLSVMEAADMAPYKETYGRTLLFGTCFIFLFSLKPEPQMFLLDK